MRHVKWLLPALIILVLCWWGVRSDLPESDQRELDASCLAFGDATLRDIVSTWDIELFRLHATPQLVYSGLLDDLRDDFDNYRTSWGPLKSFEDPQCGAGAVNVSLLPLPTREITATYLGTAHFARKSVRVKFDLVHDDGAWNIDLLPEISPP